MAKILISGLGLAALMATFSALPMPAMADELNETQQGLIDVIAQSIADNVPCDENGGDISKALKREAKKAAKAFKLGGKYVGMSARELSVGIASANESYAAACLGDDSDPEDDFPEE